MKAYLFSNKRIGTISLSVLLAISSFATPLMANQYDTDVATQSPSTSVQSAPSHESKKPPVPRDCHCKRPFRRFTFAMESLKKEGLISSTDIKTIYDALMKLPPETLDKATDKDLAAAEALYKDKILTEEQYQKISTFLKENPPKKQPN